MYTICIGYEQPFEHCAVSVIIVGQQRFGATTKHFDIALVINTLCSTDWRIFYSIHSETGTEPFILVELNWSTFETVPNSADPVHVGILLSTLLVAFIYR